MGETFLTLEDGTSSICLTDERDAVAVHATLSRHGFRLGRPATAPRWPQAPWPDRIWGVGRAGGGADALARNTGARATRTAGIAEIVRALGDDRPNLVFVPASELDVESCLQLAERATQSEIALGIVPVWSQSGLVEAARLLALRARPSSRRGWSFYDDHTADPGSDDADRQAAALRGGLEAFIYRGHGNGCDYRFGRHVLCERVLGEVDRDIEPGRCLPCHLGGACLRSGSAWKSYIGPGALNARLLIMLTCYGFVPAGSHLQHELGFARSVLRGPWVEGLVTSFREVRSSPAYVDVCARALADGMTLGEICHWLNEEAGALPGFLCFGSPSGQGVFDAPAEGVFDDAEVHEAPAEEAPQREIAPLVVTPPPTATPASPQEAFVSELAALEDSDACRALLERLRSRADPERFCSVLAQWFESHERWWVIQRWLEGAEEVAVRTRHFCGNRVLGCRTTSSAVPPRVNWLCTRCGRFADLPLSAGCPVTRRVEEGLQIELPSADFTWQSTSSYPPRTLGWTRARRTDGTGDLLHAWGVPEEPGGRRGALLVLASERDYGVFYSILPEPSPLQGGVP